MRFSDLPTPTFRPRASDDMTASIETLAEQMLALIEIVSDQEKDVQALKQRCQRLEDHNQAIMVSFTTFFHVLAAGRVAKLDEIAAIVQSIVVRAEKEERPQDSIEFLKGLARMLEEHHKDKPAEEGLKPDQLNSSNDD
jgi:hypothetical protein